MRCSSSSASSVKPFPAAHVKCWASSHTYMKHYVALLAFATLTGTSTAQQRSFATVRFGDVVQVELPRTWTYMDKALASHLNTSVEALGKVVGLSLPQGNNVILVAANAHDSVGKTKATLRISMRTEPGIAQSQLRELARSSPTEIQAMLSTIRRRDSEGNAPNAGCQVLSHHRTAARHFGISGVLVVPV